MLLRFRSRYGTARVQTQPEETLQTVLERLAQQWVENKVAIDPATLVLGHSPNEKLPVDGTSLSKMVRELELKHGDMLYIDWSDNVSSNQTVAMDSATQNKTETTITQSSLDDELDNETGLIPRNRSQLCKHGDKGMCEYCSPLPPWDKEYHEEHNIKHISFHSYLKQINQATNKNQGSSYIAPLSQPDFKINKSCRNGHEPWPKGICSKCQPSAITLKQQDFRMVDHVEFESSELVNDFIESWRSTGMQRFAYMYGKYSRYESTPLGVKAQVFALYEPAQHDEQDGLTMDLEQVDKEMQHVDKLALEMGLTRIGLIFTDLTDSGNGDGSVFCKRHKNSFFLSSLEVLVSARHQLANPHQTKYSQNGHFSSRFVTCVVSGNIKGDIDISSFQVSTDAEALVDAKMISGSTHPSMAYINETNNERYVPEIFYMKKNEYNITVKENAKPAFPVDYLLLSLTHGFPTNNEQNNGFLSNSGFPWCNRQAMGLSQDYLTLKNYIYGVAMNNDMNTLHEKLSNFHFLLYINSLQILSNEDYQLLLKVALTKDPESWQLPLLQLTESSGWQTLIMILQESM